MIGPVLHRAAGLIVSADRALPGFDAAEGSRDEDVRFHLQCRPSWHAAPAARVHEAATLDSSGNPIVTVLRSAEGFHFTYADGTDAWIADDGNDVWCTWADSASLADTCTYLSGPILGLVLRLRGALALHASAVQIGAGAIGFVGPHEAGKSTLAAALGAAGCAVVTDDVLHVRAEGTQWFVEPFAAMLKLWPDGARLAIGHHADLPLIADGWDKRALVPGGRVAAARGPLPLTALACLSPRVGVPSIEPMSAPRALLQLAANSSATHLLDSAARAAEFRILSRLVASVPCVVLAPPEQRSAYPEFVDNVLRWARAIDTLVAR